MSIRFCTPILCALMMASISLLVTPAYSDPIVISGGQVVMVSPSEGQDPPFGLTLTGLGLSFQGSFFDFVSAFGQAGGLMDLSGRLSILNPPFATSAVTVNGTPYAAIYPSGTLTFTATPFLLGPGSDLAPFDFTAPFTMTGNLAGYADASRSTPPLFAVDVAGSGVADVTGITHGSGSGAIYLGEDVNYTFLPATTPEPSSAALCAVAGAVLLWRRRALLIALMRNESVR